MKKKLTLISAVLLLMIAAANTANAQSYSISGPGSIYISSSQDYGRADLTCVPSDVSLKYVWSVEGHNGTPWQIYPNLTYSPFACLYVWPSGIYQYGYVDVICKVYDSSGTTLLGTAYLGITVSY